MDDYQEYTPVEYTSLGGKSWTAYVRPVFINVLLALVLVPAVWSASMLASGILFALLAGVLVYRCLSLKSYHLYFDEHGVWVYSGILPWNKGCRGVKWRDLDGASFHQSIGSWLFKSYSVHIGHRFTKSSEILFSHCVRGNEVASAINGQHGELVQANALT
jgi:hypothetical protein